MPWVDGQPKSIRPLTPRERELSWQAVQAEQAAIAAKAKEADDRADREEAQRREAREQERRQAAESEVAAMRTAVEADLRLAGAPTADIGRLADEAVRRFFQDRARTAAAMPSVEQTANELRAIRRGRGRVDVSAA